MNQLDHTAFKYYHPVKPSGVLEVSVIQYGKVIYSAKTFSLAKSFIKKNALKNCTLKSK